MERILIAGVDTVVGANFAARLSSRRRVAGLSLTAPVGVAGVDVEHCSRQDPETIRQHFATLRPQRLVYCGPASVSAWQAAEADFTQAAQHARHWIRVAAEFDCLPTYVSTDAVFTGPWMFHAENGDSLCPSRPAELWRTIEQEVGELCAHALIVRTNAFGWSPSPSSPSWIEQTLGDLEHEAADSSDCIRHASPILATDLAEVVLKAWHSGLVGVYHVGGGERINPADFAGRLAEQFGLPAPRPAPVASLTTSADGFGRGETSLQTRKIRRALGISMPLVTDGLDRLQAQSLDGYRDRLTANQPIREKVA